MADRERIFWLAFRRALLIIVDAIEVMLDMPKTSDLRKELKDSSINAIIHTS